MDADVYSARESRERIYGLKACPVANSRERAVRVVRFGFLG